MPAYAIDREAMNQVLGLFSRVLDIRATFFDLDDRELADLDVKERSPYCALLRRDPAMDAACRSCDRQNLAMAREQRQPRVYRCHRGLWEAVAPLANRHGHYLGALLCGQLRPVGLPTSRFPSPAHRTAYRRLPQATSERMHRIVGLLHFISQYMADRDVVRSRRQDWSETIAAYIEANLEARITVGRLAAVAGVSPSYLAHRFRAVFGATPQRHLRLRRLDRARGLLREGYTVKMAAESCGFCDAFHFSRVYRKHWGYPPSRERRRCR